MRLLPSWTCWSRVFFAEKWLTPFLVCVSSRKKKETKCDHVKDVCIYIYREKKSTIWKITRTSSQSSCRHAPFSASDSFHLTLHTWHVTLQTPDSRLYTPHSTLYTPHLKVYTAHTARYTQTPDSALESHTLHFTPHSKLYTQHFTLPTWHSTFNTLHCALHTRHSSLQTLHSPLHTPRCTHLYALYAPHSTL